MPYLDQQSLYDKWNMRDGYFAQTDKARQTPVVTYFCPTRRSAATSGLSVPVNPDPVKWTGLLEDCDDAGTFFPGALGDYTGCRGTGKGLNWWWADPPADGALIQAIYAWPYYGYPEGRPTRRLRQGPDFPDGLGKTFFFGERHVPSGLFGQNMVDNAIYNGNNGAFQSNASREQVPASDPTDMTPGLRRFGSWHPGVCPFVLGDGRILIVENSIDPVVYENLSVRFDGK